MAQTLEVIIKGQDGVSRIFKEVSKSADAAGKAVESAGKSGEQGFKRVEQAADKAEKEVKDVGSAAKSAEADFRALGTVATILGTGLAYAGNKAMEQERQIIGLRAAYREASDEMLRFAEELDNLTIFSDDDIRAGEQYFATLYNNYDMSIEQIQEMMSLTADLASMRGITFEDASNRITAAIRGEAEAAEFLGLTMNQASIDADNLTLSMSNAEAAQFRYNALLEQTNTYRGVAAEIAASDAGTIADWKDSIDDAAASVGNFLGPAATFASGLATIGFGLTGVTGGFAAMRAGGQALASMYTTRLVPALTATNLALGGVGVVLALAGAAFLKSRNDAERHRETIKALAGEYLDLQVAADHLRLSGDYEGSAQLLQLKHQIMDVRVEADALAFSIGDTKMFNGEELSGDRYRELFESYRITSEESERLSATQEVLKNALMDPRINATALAAEMDRLYWEFKRGEITADQYIDQMEYLSQNTSKYAVEAEKATEATTGLGAAFNLINQEAQGWLETLLSLNDIDEDDTFITKLLKSLGTSEGDRAAVSTFLSDLGDMYTNLDDMPGPDATHEEWVAWVNEAEHGTLQWRYRVAEANQAMLEQDAALESNTRKQRGSAQYIYENATANQRLGIDIRNTAEAAIEAAEAQERYEQAVHGAGAAVREQAFALVEMQEEYEEMVAGNLQRLLDVAGYGDPLSSWNLAGNATDMSLLAMETQHAATALDTIYRVAVGNTDAIANQSDAIHSWAEELIGVQGEYSKLDELVQAGRITGQSGVFDDNSEYAQAQRAYNDIARENAEIQEHVLTIQAKQVPLIRDQMAAYENYMQTVADMPAQQQLIALGWMDTTTAARAMEFQTLAVAAATGQLGANGEAVFTDMITGAAQADPVLKALLIDMGLISEGADGTITVNLDGAEGAKSEIGQLTDAIVNLIDLFDDGVINGSFVIDAEDNATGPIRTARTEAEDLDGTTSTINVVANDQASGVLQGLAANWGGTIATSFIDVITRRYEQGTPGKALGGVVEGYASGGVVIRAGEVGAEIAHFANGGTALLPSDGYYSVPPGTYITPNHAVSNSYGGDTHFNITVNGGDAEQIKRVFIQDIAPVLADVAGEQRRAAGVM